MKIETKIKEKYCVDCGSTVDLVELESGKYGCMECLNKIGKEQKEMMHSFISIMKKYNIYKPETQIKTLLSIVTQIEIQNGLASPILLKQIEETKERMFGNIQNGGISLDINIIDD